MAKTIKIAKFVKTPEIESRMLAQRRPARPGLYLLELRSHAAAQSSVPKRKLVITIDPEGGESGNPKPIKIRHT